MEQDAIRKLGIKKIKSEYKKYLYSNNIERQTVDTRMTDSFYILKNGNEELFWNIVFSNNFENEARAALLEILRKKSKSNPATAVNSYLSHLRTFRNFAISYNYDESNEIDDINSLKNFLLDIDCLDPLSQWTSKFNLFDVLKITRTEIRHSNMLAWLLDPNENHGFGDDIIRRFVQFGAMESFNFSDEVFDILLKNCDDFFVQREWHNIDILAISQSEKLLLCIENKVYSSEHDDQLARYKQIVDDYYAGYKKLFIYLTPEGDESSDPNTWCKMSYQDVINIIELSKNKTALIPEVEVMINNYIEAIRRDIVGDEKLVQICTDIYKKHKRAIDLIIENKPDKASELSEVFVKWAKQKTEEGLIEVDLNKCEKRYIRYKTKAMSQFLPDSADPNSGWKTNNHYFYEIFNNEGNDFYIKFEINSDNLTEKELENYNKILDKYLPNKNNENWRWRTIQKTNSKKVDEDDEEEDIIKKLDSCFEEMSKIEKELLDKLK